METVVVTGASTGIGRGCAALLVHKGFRVFGSVRSSTRLVRAIQFSRKRKKEIGLPA
jgi:short-subunit dehydrogenase